MDAAFRERSAPAHSSREPRQARRPPYAATGQCDGAMTTDRLPSPDLRRPLRTLVVDGPLALRMARWRAAQSDELALQILTAPELAARLAGGFARPALQQDVAPAVQQALAEGGFAELAPLQDLPGMVRAVGRTLDRLWSADVDLRRAAGSPRLADLGRIDGRVRESFVSGALAPPDLARAGLARIGWAPRLLGAVHLDLRREVAPVWAPLMQALRGEGATTWTLDADLATAEPRLDVCANPISEVVEALRWARELIATGAATPAEIAITAADSQPWDDVMTALGRAAELPIHASHGLAVLATFDGQACAALADVLLQGLDQDRVRRWLSYSVGRAADLVDLPPTPLRGVHPAARLRDVHAWRRALDAALPHRPDGADPRPALFSALELLARGPVAAVEAGARLLPRSAAASWRAALQSAPPAALGGALRALRTGDERDAGSAVVWAPASHLAGAPRAWVRMLGMTARAWPRPNATDPLLPPHVLDIAGEPTRPARDRTDFDIVAAAATGGWVLSYARRGATGALQTPSPLIPAGAVTRRLSASRTPLHAFSEADRLSARRVDAQAEPRLARALACSSARRERRVTPHDGAVRADHPALVQLIADPQSATSLRQLIRDPSGFLWRYALHWRDGVVSDAPLSLDDRTFGDLVHLLLQRAVAALEPSPGFGHASDDQIEAALAQVAEEVLGSWPLQRPAPPPGLWRRTLDQARELALIALTLDERFSEGTRSWTELPFGDPQVPLTPGLPWDPRAAVPFPNSPFNVRGVIDRLEFDGSGARGRVTDYKTGAPPARPARVVLAGGRELQRVLYAAAVRRHRPDTRVLARLVYLRETPPDPRRRLAGDDLDAALRDAAEALSEAAALLRSGAMLPGRDAEERWNPYALALPARGEPYFRVKQRAFMAALTRMYRIWDRP